MKNRSRAVHSFVNTTVLLATAFVLLWNSGFIGAEFALPYTDPFTLLFWRYWPLTLLLMGYLSIRNRLQWPGWPAVSIAMIVGILAHGVWLACVFFSLQYGVPAGIVALIVALQPLLTGALSGVMVGEYTPIFRWVGLLTGFAGVIIALLPRVNFTDTNAVFAYFIPFGSVIAITVASLIQRRMEVQGTVYRLPVDIALFYQSLGTALAVTIPAFLMEGLNVQMNAMFLCSMVWLVVGVSLGAYAIMWILIVRIDATRVASLFYLGPPVTMIMAWIAFNDHIQMTDVAGLLVVGIGVILTQVKRG